MIDPKFFLFDLPRSGRPAVTSISQIPFQSTRQQERPATSPRSVDPVSGVRALVVHAASGAGSADMFAVMSACSASWHWLVPALHERLHGAAVWAWASELRAAHHVREECFHPAVNGGRSRVDDWSLAIGIVNSGRGGVREPYSDWQVRMTADVARYCWARYPNLDQIVSHALLDPDRCSDPGSHFPWSYFRELVLAGNGGALPHHSDHRTGGKG